MPLREVICCPLARARPHCRGTRACLGHSQVALEPRDPVSKEYRPPVCAGDNPDPTPSWIYGHKGHTGRLLPGTGMHCFGYR